jgi:Transcriptional regulatory protein, C terminal
MLKPAVPAPVVTLDPETGYVECGAASLILTRRQRDVLAAMARCNGRPISRAALIEAGWSDISNTVSDDSIRGMIGAIRASLLAAGIPVEITNRRRSLVYACTPMVVDESRQVRVTEAWRRDLQKALEDCKDPALVDRVWSAVGA